MIEFTLKENILVFPAKGMDLAATLFCGQSFVWDISEDGHYIGTAANYCVSVYEENDFLFLEKLDGEFFTESEVSFWWHYFALDIDYPALLGKFCKNKKLCACVEDNPGIRVLRQPFFDTLLSFIISQNNHLARITSIVKRLKTDFGTNLGNGQFTFPRPEELAALSLEDLAGLRAGFRAKYLLDAAKKVASGEVSFAKISLLNDDDARKELMKIVGVGTKVADCVLLYSLRRNRIVPMDVWMKRAMSQVFPKGMPSVAKGYEGIAQQYVFCWARKNLKE